MLQLSYFQQKIINTLMILIFKMTYKLSNDIYIKI